MMDKIVLFLLLSVAVIFSASSQESANFKIEQGTFNNGGNPVPELSSANHQITIDSVGDEVDAQTVSGASNSIDSGLPSQYSPPGEVENLLFADLTTITWDPEPSVGTYNLYMGDISTLPGSYGTVIQSGLATPTTTDNQIPEPGQCLFYLVTATNRIGEEGPKGS